MGRLLWSAAKRNWRPLTCGVAFAALAGVAVVGGSWLTTAERFEVRHVETTPRQWLSDDALAARLDLASRPNLFLFDTAAAAARLEQSPWIASAEVRRAFPDGLVIELTENVPAAVAVLEDLYLVDATGRPFKRTSVAESAPLGLLIVTGLDRARAAADLDAVAMEIRAALDVAARWNRVKTRPVAREIHLDPVQGLTVVGPGGTPSVRLGRGSADELGSRMTLFDRSWESLDAGQRELATRIHLDQATPPLRVAVAFEDTP